MTLTKTAIALAAVLTLGLGLTSCTSSAEEESPAKDTKAQATALDWQLAFASCMRDHGLDWKDPDPDGGASQQKIDDQDAYDDANEKCTTTVKQKLGDEPLSEEATKWEGVYSKAADCLRKKGYAVKDSGGGITFDDEVPEAELSACGLGEQRNVGGGGK
ncbi:hypothetical protein AX769_07735 [Frondihabitans sp. PAMC 28766]|uniref:hypothetical protein n=1 Tax=Frondihabitans sp. PAMC 28766 TaxID=1795630 RepID=UPI00078B68A4|nr:hypothetical protein [Frondihabitans sp. PAMC 28766]AMM20075.1 hypothetical protein AX769_07735 [Frondihabitans sp. PAMC 28766]